MATPTPNATLEAWSDHIQRLSGGLLLAGYLVPLLKRSVLFDTSYLVWPWQLAGVAVGLEEQAATATAAGGENLAAWSLLPLIGGLIALALPHVRSIRNRSVAGAATGAAMLVLLLLVLVRENAVLGLVFTPPTRGGGALMLLGIGSCSVLAAANHTAKAAPPGAIPRWLVVAASLVVLALASLFLLAAVDAWAAWSLRALYLSLVAYALLGLWRTIQPQDTSVVTAWASALGRAILGWAAIAVVLAQSGSDDGFVTYVVQAGGGPLHVAIGAVKGFLIFVGAALLLAAGMTTTLEAGSGRCHRGGEAMPVKPTTRSSASRVQLTALVGMLLASALAGCSSPPPDLAKAVAAVGSMLSPRGLEHSAFYAVYPEGTPSDFVSFLFSPLGKAEWIPDDAAVPGRGGLVSADDVLAAGDQLRPGVVGLVPEAPEPRIHRQVVLRANDERGVVIAEAYELPGHAPVLIHEWTLPHVTLAPGVAAMARDNLENGVDAGAD
jgi:hypothetical protein